MNNKDQDKPKPQADGVPDKKETEAAGLPGHSPVENAHASGLGAMGRNDEKLPAGEGEDGGPDDVVY